MLPQPYGPDRNDYGDYCFEKFGYMGVPPPSKNGGLYTGEEFAKGAQYADVKVTPDAFYMNNVTLKSANPPPGAMEQSDHDVRPGNNKQYINNYDKYESVYCQKHNYKKNEICASNHFNNEYLLNQ
jgi:hypothetical protein